MKKTTSFRRWLALGSGGTTLLLSGFFLSRPHDTVKPAVRVSVAAPVAAQELRLTNETKGDENTDAQSTQNFRLRVDEPYVSGMRMTRMAVIGSNGILD